MLEIVVPLTPEGWDEEKNEFVPPVTQTLQLEHSLVSISQWESRWNKPFLSDKEKTNEEILDYVKYMTLTPNVDPEVYNHLTSENVDDIHDYIGAAMTATTFSDDNNQKRNREVITAEIIYHWMIEWGIPLECQYWHLSRLTTLIRVRSIKSQPPKKTSMKERASRNARLNALRRQQLNSKG